MFRMLIASDLVIADVSIHNANVFYELGIRHALRPWRTFMIRCKGDDPVFDLQTDRYLQYERERPGDSLEALVEGLRQTRAEERKDSPIYLLLPRLPVQPPAVLAPVPQGFGEAVEQAKREKRPGDLELLAEESRGFEWETVGLRTVGRAQFDWARTRVPVSPGKPSATSTATTISKPTPCWRRSTRSWAISSLRIWPYSER